MVLQPLMRPSWTIARNVHRMGVAPGEAPCTRGRSMQGAPWRPRRRCAQQGRGNPEGWLRRNQRQRTGRSRRSAGSKAGQGQARTQLRTVPGIRTWRVPVVHRVAGRSRWLRDSTPVQARTTQERLQGAEGRRAKSSSCLRPGHTVSSVRKHTGQRLRLKAVGDAHSGQ